jgi:TRAP-type C4-dicarboxylate transport system permease small subunit
MNAAATLLRAVLRAEQALTCLAFATMVGVLGLDIFGREFLGSGKIWATPIAVYCNVFIAFVGLGIASASGAHLRPRFFDKAVPKAMDASFDRFTDFGFALFALGAGVLCWKVTQESVQLQETDAVLQWQIWPFQLFLVLGFGIAVVRHTIYGLWPALRPAPAGGENAPPSQEQMDAFKVAPSASAPTSTTVAKP